MPERDVRPASHEFAPETLESFLENSRRTQQDHGERMLFARDMVNIFQRADINICWNIASANLSVFRRGLEATGHTGTCLWVEGKEAPAGVAFRDRVLDCKVVKDGDELEVFFQGQRIGHAYGMRGWVGPQPEVIGWLAMIDTNDVR